MFVGQHLELDMAWMLYILFEVEIAIAECSRSFGLRLAIERWQFLFIAHNTHPAPSSACRGFEDDRKFDLPGPLERFAFGGDYPVGPRKNRHSMLFHGGARFFLFAHQPYDVRRRPNELYVTGFAHFREISVFRKQAVAGMDRVHIGDFGGANHCWNIEIALRQLRRTNANRLVGKADVQRVPIRLAVDRHRADAELFACANDAQSNLAAIRYQNFLEHDLPGMICPGGSVKLRSFILWNARRTVPGRTQWADRWRQAS